MQTRWINRAWPVVALASTAGIAILNLADLAFKVSPPPTSGAPHAMIDVVTRSERRFAGIRDHTLEHELGRTIGYVGDSPADATVRDGDVEYSVAQFVLLPLVLDSTMTHSQWAVGNFRGSSSPSIPSGWGVVEDFGQGVLLLGKSVQ